MVLRGIARFTKISEKISGGLADGKPDSKYPADQLRIGIKVEREHSVDREEAREITKDHLEEHPSYYTALKKMEDRLEKKANRGGVMHHSREDFIRAVVKVAQDTQVGDTEDGGVAGKQSNDTPELLQPDEGKGVGFRGEEESMSSGAESEHASNREGGYLQNAFSGFDAAAAQAGKDLKDNLSNFGPSTVSSKATTNAAQTKIGSAVLLSFSDELRKITEQ